MKVNYDKTTDSKYIKISEKKVSRTQQVEDWLLLDYSEDEKVVGIEVLLVSEHQVGFFIDSNQNVQVVELKQSISKPRGDETGHGGLTNELELDLREKSLVS